MCILFTAINQHPDYPLIICANRDEYYSRPTQAASFWSDNPSIFAGRDLQAGGTWLGINLQGQFAALTNIRTGTSEPDKKKSRGELVVKALQQNETVNQQWLIEHRFDYNPFNLIFGPLDALQCFNSRNSQLKALSTGFHAISNGDLDDTWPKMAHGLKQLKTTIGQSRAISTDNLLSILQDQSKAPQALLPDTGIDIAIETLLSSIFITSETYGTRSSAVILCDNNRNIQFYEAEYDHKGRQISLTEESFAVAMNG